jgi:S1-C subfamily serine protease
VGAAAVIGILALSGTFDEEPVTIVAPAVPPAVVQNPSTEIITGAADGGIAQAVGKKVVPSIVTVQVGTITDGTFIAEATGSGVILDQEGHVVTNHHVVADADAASVTLHNGLIYEAEIIGTDPVTDLAVLKIDAAAITSIENGEATDLTIGQTAIAIGNPLGQVGGASLTVGVISALDRIVEFGPNEPSLYGMLQTDAPINSGSSGGALVDAEGKLIGITSAIGVSQAGAEGIGYAIPVELVQRVTNEIIETGQVHHTFLGIMGGDHLTETPDGALAPAGAVIDSLFGDDSAAATAGLEDGDVIIRVGDSPVTSMQDLVVALRLYRIDDTVEVEVDRGGTRLTRSVILIERPDDS